MSADGFSLLFSGSIREPHRMLEAIDTLMGGPSAATIRRIVLSTWFGEVERFPDLREELRRRGVVSVISTEPIEFRASPDRYTARGHVYHQMTALLRGIEQGRCGDLILKSRSDLKLHNVESLRGMLAAGAPVPIDPALRKFSALTHRVRVEVARPTYPFYIYDTHFVAHRRDVQTMSDLHAGYDVIYSIHNAIPEIRFFHAPFRGFFPILERALTVPYLLLRFDKDGRHDAMLGILLSDRFFLKSLFAYWLIVEYFFQVQDAAGRGITALDRLLEILRDRFRAFVVEDLLTSVLSLRRQSPAEDLAQVADPAFASDAEFAACMEKLDRLGMVVHPRVIVEAHDPRPRTGGTAEPKPLVAIDAILPFAPDAVEERRRYLDELSRTLSLTVCAGRADAAGKVNLHGIIALPVGTVLWRRHVDAYVRLTIRHGNGDEEIKSIPILSDIMFSYFFGDTVNLREGSPEAGLTFEVVVDGEVMLGSYSVNIDRGCGMASATT